MGVAANMRIAPIKSNQTNTAQFRRNAARMNWYGSRQSYILQNPRISGMAGFAAFCLSLINKTSLIGGTILLEMVGVGKQVNRVRKLDQASRQDVPKGCLAARAVGWSSLGAAFGSMLYAAANAMPSAAVFTFVGTSALGLITLGAEKIARGMLRRRNLKQTVNETQTPEQAGVLAREVKNSNLPVSEQIRLGRRMLEQTEPEVAQILIKQLDPQAIEKLTIQAQNAGVILDQNKSA